MQRMHLEEDLELIEKYFPGAKAVALSTPFGRMHTRSRNPRPTADSLHTTRNPHEGWTRGVAWIS